MGKKLALVATALMMSLAPSVGMVWVFSHLCMGGHIVPDNMNVIELYCAIFVLVLIVVALYIVVKEMLIKE